MSSKKKSLQKPKRMSTAVLRRKAMLILQSHENKHLLTEILAMFDDEQYTNFTPLLLTVEMIFTELLHRKDMYEIVLPMKPPDKTPEAIQCQWLRDAYEVALGSTITCFKKGDVDSRIQALVTACKLLREEGNNPMESCQGNICFPHVRLKNIFTALLDSEVSMSLLIDRFQEFTEYRDIQQYGLKMLSLLAFCHSTTPAIADDASESTLQLYRASYEQNTQDKAPNQVFIQNYLELFEKLMVSGLPSSPRPLKHQRHEDDNYLCERNGEVAFIFNPELCRRHINRCWGIACKWPLRASESTHRRALLLLVDRIMPYLVRPQLAADLLADSLDTGTSISALAMRGMLELVTKHKIDYPDIYDRLYGMFEPEMFETRSKKRLIHLAEVFLSSTRISESLVAAFAKRFSRLALIASPEDANDLLRLISTLIQTHPGLKRMIHHDQPAVMPKDPYVMEESSAIASRAIHSSLWEISALRLHFSPEVSETAARVLAAADGRQPAETPTVCNSQKFDTEVRKRFKTIEMNFVRMPTFANVSSNERLVRIWNMAGVI